MNLELVVDVVHANENVKHLENVRIQDLGKIIVL